jgi:DNA-binding beta-propeller fold protein YncE
MARSSTVKRCQLAAAALVGALIAVSHARAAEPLRLVAKIPLPNVEGRIDHFAWDEKNQRLLVAALGNNTVEIIDPAKGQVVGRIADLKTPQGIGIASDENRVAVANDADGSFRIYDSASLKQLHRVDLQDDADNVRYDAMKRLFWVGYGGGGLAAIDPQSGQVVQNVKLDGHPESFQLESQGRRCFVNVPSAGHIAVIDREKNAVVARWPLNGVAANFPMALDEARHRLFIGCRQPAKLLVLDTESGKTIASLEIVGDTDDLFYDVANHRIYITGGAGRIDIVLQTDANTYRPLSSIETAPGARTGLLVATAGKLYVAIPHRGSRQAEIQVFSINKEAANP